MRDAGGFVFIGLSLGCCNLQYGRVPFKAGYQGSRRDLEGFGAGTARGFEGLGFRVRDSTFGTFGNESS